MYLFVLELFVFSSCTEEQSEVNLGVVLSILSSPQSSTLLKRILYLFGLSFLQRRKNIIHVFVCQLVLKAGGWFFCFHALIIELISSCEQNSLMLIVMLTVE